MKRSNRRVIAEDTLKILEQGYYINAEGKEINIKKAQKQALQNTYLYLPEETDELLNKLELTDNEHSTQYEVTGETTLNAVRRLIADGEENVFCLNFASAKNPGGGFLGGSQAQEESIARATGLYPCLLSAKAYYEAHRKLSTCLYTDRMIYAPAVPILKDESGNVLEEVSTVTILTSPAVNAGVVRRNEPRNTDKILPIMRTRITKVLAVAAKRQHEVLVLGAWGCGVFQNDPQEIAALFRAVLDQEFNNQFKRIVFAVYSKNERFITPFRELFSVETETREREK